MSPAGQRVPQPPPLEKCALCGEREDLQESHVLPGFVVRDLRETSATGHIRPQDQPNLRSQDADTYRIFCTVCEGRFSRWETRFASDFYRPYAEDSSRTLEYDSWMSRFAASVVWRVVRLYQLNGILPEPRGCFEQAETVWREFLLGARHNVGPFELHLLPFDGTLNRVGGIRGVGEMPSNINRYLQSSVGFDLVSGRRTQLVFVKFQGAMILGFAHMDGRKRFEGSRLAMRKGRISKRVYHAPGEFANYLYEQAQKMRDALLSMSGTQKEKVWETALREPERVVGSPGFTALTRDIELFGKDAFIPDPPRKDGPDEGS